MNVRTPSVSCTNEPVIVDVVVVVVVIVVIEVVVVVVIVGEVRCFMCVKVVCCSSSHSLVKVETLFSLVFCVSCPSTFVFCFYKFIF